MAATPRFRQLREKLSQLKPDLAKEYRVSSLALFGSYLRGEESMTSDLDILVTFVEEPGLIKFIELEHRLSDELGVKVDLVMKDALKPRLGERILEEAVPV
jgi:predicted nucleotidyltransferase